MIGIFVIFKLWSHSTDELKLKRAGGMTSFFEELFDVVWSAKAICSL
ncbi:hypothetical protein [Neobacillus novalis]|nr:hypothetical protein [Neobacillus novalis]